MVKFKHMKFLNKSVKILDNKLVIDLGKGEIKEIPKGEYFASTKFDGVLCAVKDFHLLSSSLKDIPNVRLQGYFANLLDYAYENNLILFGEIYSHELTFQEIISVVMTHDKEVPESIKFYCFDAIKNEDYDEEFRDRMFHIPRIFDNLVKVEQKLLSTENPNDFKDLFEKYLDEGFEGLIIKNKNGKFKCGRTTLNEGIGFKFKPYISDDMEIIGVIQATEVREGAEKKINEMGNSVTSKKKDDRVLIEKASAFLVKWNGNEFKVSIAETDEVKEEIWKNQEKYIGEFVEVKYMMVGTKDGVPRHPTTLRMRWKNMDE